MSLDTSEPIDAVYTWVDGSDPAWQTRKAERLRALGCTVGELAESATSGVRFKNRDELRYSLRSLEQYAPFVRKVYLVTDHQVPEWLDVAHPNIELIFHQDLFPDPSDLPTFSSQAIECHIHRIPGLSERFIYLNDDFLFNRPTTPADFFDAEGRCIVYLDRRTVVWDTSSPRYGVGVNAAARNSSELLEKAFGYRIENRVDHVPYALRRSVLEEIWARFPNALEAVSRQPFRHPDTITLTSCLAQHYGLCTGTSTAETSSHLTYIKVKKMPLSPVLIGIRLLWQLLKHARRPKFLSINDAGALDDSRLTEALIERFFRTSFPRESRFERRGATTVGLEVPGLPDPGRSLG